MRPSLDDEGARRSRWGAQSSRKSLEATALWQGPAAAALSSYRHTPQTCCVSAVYLTYVTYMRRGAPRLFMAAEVSHVGAGVSYIATEVSRVGAGVSYIVTEVSRVGCVGHGPRFYLYLCMYLCMYLCTCLCMYLSVPLQQRCLVSVASDTARGFTCIHVCICG